MSDTVVMALTAALAFATVGGTGWGIWRITRRRPTRQRALSYVLLSLAGTALIGVVLPPILKGIMDPFPVWLVSAALTSTAAGALGWRWRLLQRQQSEMPRIVAVSLVLLLVLAMAGVAVT